MNKVEGIVLRTVDYGESHIIVHLLTKEAGRMAFMARGAKKPKSQLASSAQLFIHGTYLYKGSGGKGIKTLIQAEVEQSFRSIRSDILKTAYATYMMELMEKLIDENSSNPALFRLLHEMLLRMEEGKDPEVLVRMFDLKMTDVAGIRPELDACTSCGRTEGTFHFSVSGAGFLCDQCFHKDPYRLRISKKTVQLLRTLYYVDLRRLGSIELKQETKQELKWVLESYYDTYSGVFLKSKRFLEQMERLNFD